MKLNELNKRISTSLFLIGLLFLIIKYSYIFLLICIVLFVVTWIEFNNIFKKIFKKKVNLIKTKISQLLVFIYLTFFMTVLYKSYIKFSPAINLDLIYVIVICILSDIGGFLFGKFFKGKKLTKISPNKTYSGAFGSFFLSILFSILYSLMLNRIDFNDAIIFSILISFVSQIGDLFISFLKRLAKIKDTGNILPGHGGILDRIDGMLFAIPFGVILINIY